MVREHYLIGCMHHGILSPTMVTYTIPQTALQLENQYPVVKVMNKWCSSVNPTALNHEYCQFLLKIINGNIWLWTVNHYKRGFGVEFCIWAAKVQINRTRLIRLHPFIVKGHMTQGGKIFLGKSHVLHPCRTRLKHPWFNLWLNSQAP